MATSTRPPPPKPAARGPAPSLEPVDGDVDQERHEELLREQRAKKEAAERLEEEINDADTTEPMTECSNCGRCFRESILNRHETACAKASKKRQAFDMAKQRADGVDGLQDAQRTAARAAKRNPGKAQPQAAIPKWKLQHMQFQQAMHAAHGDAGGGYGGPAHFEEPADDRVPCPHCGRKFARDTAERHIPKCTAARPVPMRR